MKIDPRSALAVLAGLVIACGGSHDAAATAAATSTGSSSSTSTTGSTSSTTAAATTGGTGGDATGGSGSTSIDGTGSTGGTGGDQQCGGPPTWTGSLASPRGDDVPDLPRSSYDYAPTIIQDEVYRMWWCGGVAGDHILYAEATAIDGPWHAHGSTTPGTYDDVFAPTGVASDFDAQHTCDPSVIRVDGSYYLYYGGLGGPGTTEIGLATSNDGLSWTRANAGAPIIVPHAPDDSYGAGQPSALYRDGLFYIVFTDTTGAASNPVNGGGQFVLRSADPTFQSGVEELYADGFGPYDPNLHTSFKAIEAFSVDWMYSDAIDAFVMAIDAGSGHTNVRLFDCDAALLDMPTYQIQAVWAEGPGLIRRADGHAPPGAACGDVPIDYVRAIQTQSGAGPNGWDLGHAGVDLHTDLACDDIDLPRLYEGTLLAASGRPLTLVRGGTRLQFAEAAPAYDLAGATFSVPVGVFDAIPYGASMHTGDEVLGATNRPAAFHLDDDRLWPVDCLEAITDNGSSITPIDVATWDGYAQAPALHCIR